MKKKDKLLLYSEKVKIEKILMGSIWAFSGICSLFSGILSCILRIISMLIIIYTIARVSHAKTETADEMADQNMNKAKAVASDYIHILSYLAADIALFLPQNIVLSVGLDRLIPAVVFFVTGCHSVITGLAFKKYEDS